MAFLYRPCNAAAAPASGLLEDVIHEYGAIAGTPFVGGIEVTAADFSPPDGAYLVGFDDDSPVCGGGLRTIAPDTAEIKRMYVIPAQRGRGAARGLLAALERHAVETGHRVIRLDSKADTWPFYSAAGYVEIPDYNDNPHADVWGEKLLRHGN